MNGVTLLSVKHAADNLIVKLLQNVPSVTINEKCNYCSYINTSIKHYLTICVSEKNPTKWQLNNIYKTK